jgi:hypothetical protein
MSITGTLYIDAGAILGMHQNSSAVVNSGGVLRVTGTNPTTVATVSRRATTSGWQMTINGELRAQFAVFEHSGGDGITLGASGTLNATQNLSNTTFRNGIGNSYLTTNANLSPTISNISFTAGPTHNISATTGAYTITNYSGTGAGAKFENDGGTHPGYVIWELNQSQAITGVGTYNYGNEVIINITANSGLTNVEVDYRDELYESDYNALPRYFRLLYTGGTATGNLIFSYADNELGAINEADLRIWVHKGGLDWVNLGGTLDMVNNTLTVNGYTLGEGTAAETINKANPEGAPSVLDGSEDFLISDANNEVALPVELTRFEVQPELTNGKTSLIWETATEKENYGFYINRSFIGLETLDETQKQQSDTTWVELAFIEGKGNSTESQTYTFIDEQIEEAGRYLYRLVQMDFDGKTTAFEPVEFLFSGPESFRLGQNYPNPFNPITIIPYDVAQRSQVRIDVFNVLGQRVQTLVNEVKNPGSYRLDFNASQLASGMYIVRYTVQGK